MRHRQYRRFAVSHGGINHRQVIRPANIRADPAARFMRTAASDRMAGRMTPTGVIIHAGSADAASGYPHPRSPTHAVSHLRGLRVDDGAPGTGRWRKYHRTVKSPVAICRARPADGAFAKFTKTNRNQRNFMLKRLTVSTPDTGASGGACPPGGSSTQKSADQCKYLADEACSQRPDIDASQPQQRISLSHS